LQDGSNIAAAALFVIGCVGFYSPRLNTAATTAFLLGSVLFLVSALSAATATETADRTASKNRPQRRSTNVSPRRRRIAATAIDANA
jgi:hypothetical protein